MGFGTGRRVGWLVFQLFVMTAVQAGDLTVQVLWDPNEEIDLAGYRVHWGTTPSRMNNSQDVGLVTSCWLTGLDDQASYYIAVTAVDFWGNESAPSNNIVVASGDGPALPQVFDLSPGFPNPCKPTSQFDVRIPQEGPVTVAVYNLLGEKIREIENNPLPAGQYRYEWNGVDELGAPVPAGIYFIHLKAGEVQIARRLTLIR
ncbi:T9SS type A sorting domain-containing protein [candidate division KSB1 bacterium]|nr:T9SS type A sorting domain-containing protein [candidate division KSB1 bacterium]